LRVCLLASGSKGNAVYIESEKTRILVDVGLSAREIERRLGEIDVPAESLDAILVTHEHLDHVRGVGPLARRYHLPLYMHPETHSALSSLGKIEQLHEFEAGEPFVLRDLEVRPFAVTHDATAPVGFVFNTRAGKIGFATDLGIATRLVADSLRDCRMLVLESNHDEKMLQDGPYPWHLKQRIRSRHGHLSNDAASELLDGLLWQGLDAVFLAHLSETNNMPDKAFAGASAVLSKQNLCDPQLVVGTQERISACIELE